MTLSESNNEPQYRSELEGFDCAVFFHKDGQRIILSLNPKTDLEHNEWQGNAKLYASLVQQEMHCRFGGYDKEISSTLTGPPPSMAFSIVCGPNDREERYLAVVECIQMIKNPVSFAKLCRSSLSEDSFVPVGKLPDGRNVAYCRVVSERSCVSVKLSAIEGVFPHMRDIDMEERSQNASSSLVWARLFFERIKRTFKNKLDSVEIEMLPEEKAGEFNLGMLLSLKPGDKRSGNDLYHEVVSMLLEMEPQKGLVKVMSNPNTPSNQR